MEIVFLILAVAGLVVAIVIGFLQFIVPFAKQEVKFSKKFPFVTSITEATTIKIDSKAYAKTIAEEFPIPENRKPIAVMPFKNLTGENSLDYLSFIFLSTLASLV